jgi:membrane protein implicated in regulation of membrane protease activity
LGFVALAGTLLAVTFALALALPLALTLAAALTLALTTSLARSERRGEGDTKHHHGNERLHGITSAGCCCSWRANEKPQ